MGSHPIDLGLRFRHESGFTRTRLALGAAAVVHYVVSYDRIAWLVKQ